MRQIAVAHSARRSAAGHAPLLLLEESPGIGQPERVLDLRSGHRGRATAPNQAGLHNPGRGAALGDDHVLQLAAQTDRPERAADPPDRELALPMLVRRASLGLVRVVDTT